MSSVETAWTAGRAGRVRDGRRLAAEALEAILAADRAFLEPLDERGRDAVASGRSCWSPEQQERT